MADESASRHTVRYYAHEHTTGACGAATDGSGEASRATPIPREGQYDDIGCLAQWMQHLDDSAGTVDADNDCHWSHPLDC